ncbi:MAG: hypothetical protein PHG82_02635 [Candidatus Gracilibacteria bacterium]|nr:hypothetical protein [Candidatus Gracilibacteria bacterium]
MEAKYDVFKPDLANNGLAVNNKELQSLSKVLTDRAVREHLGTEDMIAVSMIEAKVLPNLQKQIDDLLDLGMTDFTGSIDIKNTNQEQAALNTIAEKLNKLLSDFVAKDGKGMKEFLGNLKVAGFSKDIQARLLQVDTKKIAQKGSTGLTGFIDKATKNTSIGNALASNANMYNGKSSEDILAAYENKNKAPKGTYVAANTGGDQL